MEIQQIFGAKIVILQLNSTKISIVEIVVAAHGSDHK